MNKNYKKQPNYSNKAKTPETNYNSNWPTKEKYPKTNNSNFPNVKTSSANSKPDANNTTQTIPATTDN